jgi:hypothetical protein
LTTRMLTRTTTTANTRSRARRSVTTTIENGDGSPNNRALDKLTRGFGEHKPGA